MKMTELDASVRQDITEGWSQKYKSSINCSHPKGFSQKAHCAGKKKHNESVETEMTCPDCGMCKTHGSLNEIKKGSKDSNGFTKCWPGKHAEGTKKGKNGKPVRNCVPNESVSEMRDRRDSVQRDYDSSIAGMDGSDKREFKRREMEHELGHETNNYAVSINGKTWKVFGSRQEANRVSNAMERKYPDKKIGVHATGAEISESATLGATSAANVGVGAIYKNKPVSQPKNKNGTAKNALDMKGANLLGGGSIKR
jgi:hypothetical protein